MTTLKEVKEKLSRFSTHSVKKGIFTAVRPTDVFEYNITHNLGKMALEAGIYYYLWRPEERGITKAEQLIEVLQIGLDVLKSNPDKFKKLNPENGWGDYEGLVKFVEKYLETCKENPSAEIRVSR